MKTTRLILSLLLVLGVVGQSVATEPLQPLTIQLNWLPNVQFAGILLAQERGWYKAAGIDLTITSWGDNIVPLQEVVAGRAQIALAEGAEFLKVRSEGAALTAIAAQFQKSPFCLISKQARGITTPAQLIGKKIGMPDSETELMLNIVLASQNIPVEQIIPVKISWGVQPLLDDEIDVLAGYMSDEVLTLKEQGVDVTYFPAFQFGYDFYSNVYVVTDALRRTQPELIQKFLTATLRGWQEALRNPAAAVETIVAQYATEGSVPHQTESLKLFLMLATIGEGKKIIGWMDEPTWQQGIDALTKLQQIPTALPVQDVFTLEFLNQLYFGQKHKYGDAHVISAKVS